MRLARKAVLQFSTYNSQLNKNGFIRIQQTAD